ncbi:MAG TPA: N-acetylneuraminate synthase [Hyphomicrobiaceae bacterium]|nr:N-acetylneuraminate synthase [Hyphomicrobiaceae bacterium]
MTVILAEAGVNHNGRLDLALALVDAAADAGADIVKFQTFKASALVTASAKKAHYQTETTGGSNTQYEMLKALELDLGAHRAIVERCRERRIEFLSTPFDAGSLDLLVRDLGVKRLKIGSGDMNNAPHVLAIARTGADIILSTGMATVDEIEEALGVIAFGFSGRDGAPSRAAFKAAWADAACRATVARKTVVLHCTTAYPTPPSDINLKAMDDLSRRFQVPIGFSDHSDGIAIPIAAVARGAVMIEKHITLDRAMEGPDHRASLDPVQFAAMVRGIRDTSAALGHGRKEPTALELGNAGAARKSVVAARGIAAGEVFTAEVLGIKRPGIGLAPIRYWELIGRRASRAYAVDDLIEETLD